MKTALEIGEEVHRRVEAQLTLTPANEVQYVADYQEGWNDAQAKRPHKFDASIYYSAGFVDGSYAGTWQ